MQERCFTVAVVVAFLGFPTLLPAPTCGGGCFGVVGVSSDDMVRLNLLNEVRPGRAANLASVVQAQTTPPCFDCVAPGSPCGPC